MNPINSLNEANEAVENGMLVRVDLGRHNPERVNYYTASKDGWQKGYLAAAGTVGHEVVDVDTVRKAVVDALTGEGTVKAVEMSESPWGENGKIGMGGDI